MSQIEFIGPVGFTFTVALRNATTYSSIASGLACTSPASGVYRCNTGSASGIVFVEAVSGALRLSGFANLDEPNGNGYSEVLDSYAAAAALGSTVGTPIVTVLPGRDRALPQSNRSRIVVAIGERITISRQVVDGNGQPLSLAGRTLQLVIQDARGTDLAVVPDDDITVSGDDNDTYSFDVPAGASARAGNFTYALNDVGTSKAELVKGDWIVESRPLADS